MKLTEKQKNCLYCHHSKQVLTFTDNWHSPLATMGIVLTHSALPYEDSYFEVAPDHGGKVGVLVEFNYCPMCGRPLNEKGEEQ